MGQSVGAERAATSWSPRPQASIVPAGIRAKASEWEAAAWGAIAATALVIGITCWWLTQDRSIPPFDAGLHLSLAFNVHHELAAGHVLKALKLSKPYPPFTYLIGTLGIMLGGENVVSPIVAENLVFVPLLALGCYRLGKRAFSPLAGFLAVVFALGSPLAIAQFHVFMTDVPESAMVAVSVWLIVESEHFTRVGVSALAGISVALGMLTKEPFVFFVAGPIGVTGVRIIVGGVKGRWPGWRGPAAFVVFPLLIALPWYAAELSTVHEVASGSVLAAGSEPLRDIAPGRFTIDNLTWYFWNMINAQLWAPLFAFSVIGWLTLSTGVIRRRLKSPLTAELMVGAIVAWIAITETYVHDTRYSEPLLVYLAVIGTGWVTVAGRRVRLVSSVVLVCIAAANTLGVAFGVGDGVRIANGDANTLQLRGGFTLFWNGGFLVGSPHRDGDIQQVLDELHSRGIDAMTLRRKFYFEGDFSAAGLTALGQAAGVRVVPGPPPNKHTAQFIHEPVAPGDPQPCLRLSDGTGVWIVLGNPQPSSVELYCPSRRPSFYPLT